MEYKYKPDFRNDTGKSIYQFITGIMHFGAYATVHFTFTSFAERMQELHGRGTLEDDGIWLTYTTFEFDTVCDYYKPLQRLPFDVCRCLDDACELAEKCARNQQKDVRGSRTPIAQTFREKSGE